MTAMYNEIDPYAAQWLRNLIAAGHLPAGDVDERDIREVEADDVRGYTQAHFFAGIGGWPLALRMAGWPDDRPVWTGSCPCQPFSSAGKRKGVEDERHLWPVWQLLIAECRPASVFGEQVASADALRWLAGVQADLELAGYAVASADLPAAGVAAPHRRRRLWFVADAPDPDGRPGECGPQAGTRQDEQRRARPRGGGDVGMGDATGVRLQRNTVLGRSDGGQAHEGGLREPTRAGSWSDSAIVWCDERALGRGWVARRVEPGVEPLAHGISGRVGMLRAYGNAIVPQVAAEFVTAFMEVIP